VSLSTDSMNASSDFIRSGHFLSEALCGPRHSIHFGVTCRQVIVSLPVDPAAMPHHRDVSCKSIYICSALMFLSAMNILQYCMNMTGS
jgi:hypothetical protein